MKRTWVKCQNSTSLSFLYSLFLIFLLPREVYSSTFHSNQIENFDNRIPINREKPKQKATTKGLKISCILSLLSNKTEQVEK